MTAEPMTTPAGEELLWPRYAEPADLAAIEAVPLAARGLPESTYALLARAATRWPDRTAITVLPDAARWREPLRRTFAELLADVHRTANLLHRLGVRRGDAVALLAPNCAELITATLAAQLAGIAAPMNAALHSGHIAELLRRSGARVLVARRPGACAGDLADRAGSRRRGDARRGPGAAADRGRGSTRAAARRRRGARRLPRRSGRRHGLGRLRRRPAGLGRSRRPVPHRRHHRGAEAGRAHARQRGRRRMDDRRQLAVRLRLGGVRRAAAVPRQRAGGHPAGAAVQGTAGGVGRSARLPGTGAVRRVLEDRRALPDRGDERGADRVRRACAAAGGRRHQQPAVRHRRRLTAARRGPVRLRGAHRGAPGRGVRADRGDLRQRLQLPRRAAARLGRPAAALPAAEGGTGRDRRQLGRPARRPDRRAGDQRSHRVPRLRRRPRRARPRAGRHGQADRRLARHRRPRRCRRGRLRPPGRPSQGSDHPRRPQHRPGDRRGRAARASTRHRGRGGRPPGRPCRRGAGGLRHRRRAEPP